MSSAFDIIGTPKPQGSKRAFTANGRAMMKESGGNAFAAWRNAVADKARAEAERLGGCYDVPLRLDVTFRFPMPKSRRAALRRLGMIPKTTAPDTSKLVRALEDGLQAGGLIRDDALIADLHAVKIEVWDNGDGDAWTGAAVAIRPWNDWETT